MQEIKYNTINIIRIGVVVNSTGVTPVTNLTIDAADEAEILKWGTTGTQAISGTLTAIANCDGWYLLTLAAAECDAKGPLTVVINDDSACLPIYRDFMIVDAGYYDSKYSTTLHNVNIESISGDTAAADNLELAYDGTGYIGGVIIPKVDIDSIRGATATAANLKSAYDGTGYIGGIIIPKVDIDSIRGATATAVNLGAAYNGTGYVGGTILQKVNVDALQASTASAADLKDFSDNGYEPTAHVVNFANITSVGGVTSTAVNLANAFNGTGYVGGTILQKVNVDALQASTASAADLKDFADTGYDPIGHMVAASVTGGDATLANQTDMIDKLKGIMSKAYTLSTAIGTFAPSTDSLEAVRDRGDVAWITGGGGAGANAITITVIDAAAAAIPDVDVEVWDNANAVFVTKDDTDAGGHMSTNLDSANYVIRMLKAGYTFSNHTLTVAAPASATYTGTAWVVGTPAAADLCRVYMYAKNSAGTILNGCVGTARITGMPHDDGTSFYSNDEQTGTYATATGLWYVDLVKGATAQLKIGDLEIQQNITVPATASVALTTLR